MFKIYVTVRNQQGIHSLVETFETEEKAKVAVNKLKDHFKNLYSYVDVVELF